MDLDAQTLAELQELDKQATVKEQSQAKQEKYNNSFAGKATNFIKDIGNFAYDLGAGAGKGIVDIPIGIGQLGADGIDYLFNTNLGDKVDDLANKFNKQYQSEVKSEAGSKIGQIIGGVGAGLLAPEVLPSKASMLANALKGFGTGAVQGLATPIYDNEHSGQSRSEARLANTAFGAGVGGALPLATGLIGKAGLLRKASTANEIARNANQSSQDLVNLLRQDHTIVDGSIPTVTEIAPTPAGIAQYNRLKNRGVNIDNKLSLAQRLNDNNQARVQSLQNVAGTPDEFEALKQLRSNNYSKIGVDNVEIKGALAKALEDNNNVYQAVLSDKRKAGINPIIDGEIIPDQVLRTASKIYPSYTIPAKISPSEIAVDYNSLPKDIPDYIKSQLTPNGIIPAYTIKGDSVPSEVIPKKELNFFGNNGANDEYLNFIGNRREYNQDLSKNIDLIDNVSKKSAYNTKLLNEFPALPDERKVILGGYNKSPNINIPEQKVPQVILGGRVIEPAVKIPSKQYFDWEIPPEIPKEYESLIKYMPGLIKKGYTMPNKLKPDTVKDIIERLRFNSESAFNNTGGAVGNQERRDLSTAYNRVRGLIEQQQPSYKKANQQYYVDSIPITNSNSANRLLGYDYDKNTGNINLDITKNSNNSAGDIQLNKSTYQSALAQILRDKYKPSDEVVQEVFNPIAKDLQRQSVLNSKIGANGSDTAYYLNNDNIPAVGGVGKFMASLLGKLGNNGRDKQSLAYLLDKNALANQLSSKNQIIYDNLGAVQPYSGSPIAQAILNYYTTSEQALNDPNTIDIYYTEQDRKRNGVK